MTASSILNVLQLAFLAPEGPVMLFWGSWTFQERFPLLDTEILVHRSKASEVRNWKHAAVKLHSDSL